MATQSETKYSQQSLTDLLRAYWKVRTRCGLNKSEELKYVLQVYARETTLGDKKYDCCRLKLMAQRHLEHDIKDFHFKARNRDEDRPAIGAARKGKAKARGKDNASKKFQEWRLHPLDHNKATVHLQKHARPSMTQKTKAKRTTSFTFSDRFTAPKLER